MSKKEIKQNIAIPTEIVDSVPANKEEMSLEQLKKEMVRGMVSVESSLFNHASSEQTRLERLRGCVGGLEAELFNPEFIEQLTDKSKILLYQIASENMQNVVNFMMALHKTVADGANTLNQIEEMQRKGDDAKKRDSESDVDFAHRIQDMVKEKIIKRLKDEKK